MTNQQPTTNLINLSGPIGEKANVDMNATRSSRTHVSTPKCFKPSLHQTLVLLFLVNPMMWKFNFHLWTYLPLPWVQKCGHKLCPPGWFLALQSNTSTCLSNVLNLPNFKKPRHLFGWFLHIWISWIQTSLISRIPQNRCCWMKQGLVTSPKQTYHSHICWRL